MAFKLSDRVRETTTTTGTGDLALGGTTAGFRSFGSVLGTGDTTWYALAGPLEFEVGLGTLMGPNTLARTEVLASSAGGARVDLSVGTKEVFITMPAQALVVLYGLQTALDAKAPLASPDLSGTPSAPTADPGTNTAQIASTAFVAAALAVLGQDLSEADDALAQAFTQALALKAPVDSPILTGAPTAPTATAGTGTGQVATTAFVVTEILARALAKATGTELATGTSDAKFLTAKAARDANTPLAITYASTITPDLNQRRRFTVTAGGAMTVGLPANIAGKVGEVFTLDITQDATGSRAITFHTAYDFMSAGTPVASTSAGKRDSVTCRILATDGSARSIEASYRKAA